MDVVGSDIGRRGRRDHRVEGVLGMSGTTDFVFVGMTKQQTNYLADYKSEIRELVYVDERKREMSVEPSPKNRQARRAAERKAQKLLARSAKRSAHRKAKAARKEKPRG